MSNWIDEIWSVAALFQATHLGKLPAASEMLPGRRSLLMWAVPQRETRR
ncbi:hypothetical protein [Nostoc sp.]